MRNLLRGLFVRNDANPAKTAMPSALRLRAFEGWRDKKTAVNSFHRCHGRIVPICGNVHLGRGRLSRAISGRTFETSSALDARFKPGSASWPRQTDVSWCNRRRHRSGCEWIDDGGKCRPRRHAIPRWQCQQESGRPHCCGPRFWRPRAAAPARAGSARRERLTSSTPTARSSEISERLRDCNDR